MSSSSAVQQGECLNLFKPNDPESLINCLFYYIYKKDHFDSIYKHRLDGIIHEENIYKYHPDKLGIMFRHGIEGKMYFFTPTRKMHQGGQKINRVVEGGPAFWKNTNKGKDVKHPNGIVGNKQTFSFREGQKQKSIGWIMQEYRLTDVPAHAGNLNQKVDDSALCIIYKESRGSSNHSGAIIDRSNQLHEKFNTDDRYDSDVYWQLYDSDGDWRRHVQDY